MLFNIYSTTVSQNGALKWSYILLFFTENVNGIIEPTSNFDLIPSPEKKKGASEIGLLASATFKLEEKIMQ